MLKKYFDYDGLVHVYPQWLPSAAYEHIGKELFDKMTEGCDHIILRGGYPPIMDFVPQKTAEKESVRDKIKQGQADKTPPGPNKKKTKNHKKDGQEH
jgi:hypothetical protein